MKNIYGIILAALSLSSISIGAQAHTCPTEEVEIPFYYGEASCTDYDSTFGWVTLSEYFSSSASSPVWLTETVTEFNYQTWERESALMSCWGTLPFSGTRTVEVEGECEHNHEEPSQTTIAIADVQDDEMDVFDSSCNWRGWQNQTMVRQNKLLCDGEEIATVSLIVGAPYNGEECSDNILADGYSLEATGSGRCHVTIYRND